MWKRGQWKTRHPVHVLSPLAEPCQPEQGLDELTTEDPHSVFIFFWGGEEGLLVIQCESFHFPREAQ